MTEPFDEYGEHLRRILHAEAEKVTPSPGGLEQIRAKVNERRERRFTAWITAPWLRPLVAVAVAVFLTAGALSATPALKTFVQTGHFSQEGRHDGGSASLDGNFTGVHRRPPGPGHPGLNGSPRPGSASPSTPGTHVVTGSECPHGEEPLGSPTATGEPTAAGDPTPQLTCQSGTATSTTSKHPVTPPQVSSPVPQVPSSDQPTGGTQPSAPSSP